MSDQGVDEAGLPPLRRGQCPTVKEHKRCVRPEGHTGLCDTGPSLLSLDVLFGPPED